MCWFWRKGYYRLEGCMATFEERDRLSICHCRSACRSFVELRAVVELVDFSHAIFLSPKAQIENDGSPSKLQPKTLRSRPCRPIAGIRYPWILCPHASSTRLLHGCRSRNCLGFWSCPLLQVFHGKSGYVCHHPILQGEPTALNGQLRPWSGRSYGFRSLL